MHIAEIVSNRRASFVLGVLIVTVFAASMNRQILFLIIEPLKAEMALSDADIGILTGLAPGILAGGGAILLGWLADHMPRHLLLGLCILVWSAATAVLGFAYTFVPFLIGVLALALGETAVTPVANSVIPDIFAGRRRVLANLIFFAAGVIAVGMGAALSGALLQWVQVNEALLPSVLQSMVYWRSAFVIVAAIGLPVALLVFSIGLIERRSVNDESFHRYRSLGHYAREHGVAAFGLYLAMALTMMAGLAVMAWSPTYIIRVFGVTPGEVGLALGVASTVGGLAGVLIAALVITKLLSLYGSLAPRHLYKYAMLLTIVPGMLQLFAASATQAYILYATQIMFANLGIALSSTMIQDISPAKFRGRMFGISIMLVGVVSSFGPLAVGLISDQFAGEARGLLWAIIMVMAPALTLSALCIGLTNKQYQVTADNLAVS